MEIASPSAELREPMLLSMFLALLRRSLIEKKPKLIESLILKCENPDRMTKISIESKQVIKKVLEECRD